MSDATFTYESIREILREAGRFALLEKIQSAGAPLEIANRYFDLHKDAYWKHKDVALMVALATAGIAFCITRAAADESLALQLRGIAKGLAYNLASFTWPGWGDAELTPTAEQTRLGHEAAKFNLRLALELQKPPDKVRGAHWLLGAHRLAASETRAALDEFEKAMPPDVADPDRGLFEGYVLLARCMLGEMGAKEPWEKLLGVMKEKGNEEATFAREQLLTAKRYFDSRAKPDA